jgi:hypothetical protein
MSTAIETNSKYNAIREEQRKQGPRAELLPLLPFEKRPLLPEAAPLPERREEPAPAAGAPAGSAPPPGAAAAGEKAP